ncbi:MAG: chemotaxis protein CheD [Deltaproteobacteria bacterium]|nr:chemotaxis protein CheD [Deltaproteobacteria bacterium]
MTSKSENLVPTNYLLQPGYVYVPIRPTVISTVLGSSISVCIYDAKRRVGGMNHFQFPYTREIDEATPRYGNVATLALISMMLHDGSRIEDLEAQIFGGAHNKRICDQNIGWENGMVARKILMTKQVRIVSQDIGGEKGRKVVYNTISNEIIVMKVDELRRSDWFPYREERIRGPESSDLN